MKLWLQLLIVAYILSMVNSVHTFVSKGRRPSKYKAQMFYYGVPEKIQALQIPEKCSNKSSKGGKGKMSSTYVLSYKSEPVEVKPMETKPVNSGPEVIKPAEVNWLILNRLRLNLMKSNLSNLNLPSLSCQRLIQ